MCTSVAEGGRRCTGQHLTILQQHGGNLADRVGFDNPHVRIDHIGARIHDFDAIGQIALMGYDQAFANER